jgi:N-acetyl-alpha-D-glucosaminyl L-malate synthase BshA
MSTNRSSLRIGIACFSWFGGSGVVAAEVGMALGRRGHRVCFLSDKQPARLDPNSPNVSFHAVPLLDYPVPTQRSYALALAAKMFEVAHAEKLDLLHVHYAVPHALSALLARQALGLGAPKLLVTLHGTDVTLLGADALFRPLTKLAVAAGDGITTPSRWLADTAYHSLGLPRETHIEVIPNFVDTDLFVPASRARQPHAPRVLTHVSSFRPIKRVDDVVKVFAAVRTLRPTRLALIGDGPERPRIQSLVRELGLAQDVCFHGEVADLVALYQASDVFLMPSASESFGLAALEAMACGLPVVAADVGGLPEVVVDGETGFLVPVGDVAVMADRVRRLLDDDALHARMSAAASGRARSHFRVEPAIDRYEAAYRRLVG